jgi:hypothetical protein
MLPERPRVTAVFFILSPQKTPASAGGEMNAVFVSKQSVNPALRVGLSLA